MDGTEAPETQKMLVLDGHDAVGKTTLVPMLAERLGGVAVRPFADELGDFIAWLWRTKRFEEADRTARLAVERVTSKHAEAPVLVFDRHWLTMFTVLPESMHANWQPLPPTILFWADAATTMKRLGARGERIGERAHHEHWTAIYRDLAERYGAVVVDTTRTTPGEALDTALRLIRRYDLRIPTLAP